MVQRLKTAKEAWLGIIKTLYLLFAFPFLLFIGVVMFFSVTSESSLGRVKDDVLGTLMIWAVIIVSVGLFMYGMRRRRRTLKSITAAFRDPDFFSPDEGYEMYKYADGKYLGIDTRNGTILYVHRIRKGQVDVVGLSMHDWTSREVQDNGVFRLYTKLPDLPCIEIHTPWAQRWYDTLGAMEYKEKEYSTPQPFSQYVRDRLDALELEHKIHIPRLA